MSAAALPTFAPLLAGIALHAAVQPFEPDLVLPQLAGALGVLSSLYVVLRVHFFSSSSTTIMSAQTELAQAGASAALGFVASMVVYRGWLHRLRRFPGPRLARLSKGYAVWKSARGVQWHRELERLHGEFGECVRTGPRELSLTRAEAVAPLAACRKSTLYALSHWDDANLGLIETRSLADHRRRRKPWDVALGAKALASYDAPMQRTVGDFLDVLAAGGEAGKKPVNVTELVAYLAYDVMGVVGFGRDFGQLRGGGVEHWAVRALRAQQLFIGVLKPVPWLLNALAQVPGADGPVRPFVRYCAGLVKEKMEFLSANNSATDTPPTDILSHILRAYEAKSLHAPPTQRALDEDGRTIVIAGADTTSNTLTNALYYLSRHLHTYARLQREISTLFPGGPATFTYAHLAANQARAPLLDAVLNETMRLKPATPGGNPRVTPPEGLRIPLESALNGPVVLEDGSNNNNGVGKEEDKEKGTHELFIPGHTDVYISPYVLQRSPRYFALPHAFVPERWIDGDGGRPELIREQPGAKNAFFPFQIGQFACAGKALAMWEMRSVLARVVLRFDLEREEEGDDDDDDAAGREFDEGMKDTFTMTLGPLWLRFKERGVWWEEREGKRV